MLPFPGFKSCMTEDCCHFLDLPDCSTFTSLVITSTLLMVIKNLIMSRFCESTNSHPHILLPYSIYVMLFYHKYCNI